MKRPKPNSQAGRILHLLESANGGKVSLLDILNLRISQYSARIHDLRHKFGFRIVNGCDPGNPAHTWFRLESGLATWSGSGSSIPSPDQGLFSVAELERTAKWSDNG